MPLIMFIGNPGFVAVSVIGGIMVTQRAITIGDVQAFIQYSRQFSQPITQLANIANVIQLTIVSAERIFELLDEKAVSMPICITASLRVELLLRRWCDGGREVWPWVAGRPHTMLRRGFQRRGHFLSVFQFQFGVH